MAEDDKENFFGILETRGEAKVRAMLDSREWGERERLVREWLQIQDIERMTEQEKQDIRMVKATERSANAAEKSAEAAKDSARHSKNAARWAMWAVIVAIVAVVVTIALH